MFSLPLLPCVTPPLMDSVSGGAMMASVLALSQMHLKDRSNIRSVAVPVSLLFSKELTPAAKFVWIRLRFDEIHRGGYPHLPRQLKKRTGLSRSTVYDALRQGAESGWFVKFQDPKSGRGRWKTVWPDRGGQRVVHFPVALIRAAHVLRPQSILCYGILQLLPDFRAKSRSGTFKWAELSVRTGLHLRTIKRAIRALAESRWIVMAQKHRRARIWFRLLNADHAYKEEVRAKLDRVEYAGEALMRSFLSLIVDTKECEDGARPEFLVNPASGERMEFDRYYPLHRVAFEFNGKQHYVATGPYTKQQVTAQRKRDRLKRQICKEKGIDLVVVHANDLSLTGMLRKVGSLLPRRALRGFRETIRYLNHLGRRYQQSVMGI